MRQEEIRQGDNQGICRN